ncbi:hypothetical protein, partial [Leptospira alstonii]
LQRATRDAVAARWQSRSLWIAIFLCFCKEPLATLCCSLAISLSMDREIGPGLNHEEVARRGGKKRRVTRLFLGGFFPRLTSNFPPNILKRSHTFKKILFYPQIQFDLAFVLFIKHCLDEFQNFDSEGSLGVTLIQKMSRIPVKPNEH